MFGSGIKGNGLKRFGILFLSVMMLCTSSGCGAHTEKEEEIKEEVPYEADLAKEEETVIDVWTVDPLFEFSNVENWLTTRAYGHSSLYGSGQDAGYLWPLDDFSISYNRNDFYNSEGKDAFIIGSFEKGGAMFKKDGYWGLINAEGEIVTEPKYRYRTHQTNGVIFSAGSINHDYTIFEREFGGGGSGLSAVFMNKEGKVFSTADSFTANTFVETDLFEEAVKKGFVEEDGYILLNAYAALLDFRNYYPYINLPKDLIEGYVSIDKNGFSVLSMPRNYVVNDFSQGIMVFAGCNTDPRTIYPEMENGSLSYDALMMNYYAYELYCDDYSYRDFTFVDRSGKIIASGFDDAYGFYEDYAAVKKNGKWGYIDKNGNLAVDFIFDKATAISDGSAWVIYKGKTGRLNIGGLLNNGIVIDDEVLSRETVTIE